MPKIENGPWQVELSKLLAALTKLVEGTTQEVKEKKVSETITTTGKY